MSEDQSLHAVYLIALLSFLILSGFGYMKAKPKTTLKYITAWVGIILFLVIIYGFRYEFITIKDRFIAELFPRTPISSEDGSVSIRISEDGHYRLYADIDGTKIEFMVDTGASDIVLSMDDAKKIGVWHKDLLFNKTYQTANGPVRGASVRVNRMTIGHIQRRDIFVSINQGEMQTSLLGMRFLDTLSGYQVENGTLTLWP